MISNEILKEISKYHLKPIQEKKVVSLLDTIQEVSRSTIKIKKIRNSPKYVKIATRYTIFNLHTVINAVCNKLLGYSIFLTTQTDKHNRVYLTIYLDYNEQTNHINHKKRDNKPSNLGLLERYEHIELHKTEYLLKVYGRIREV